MKKIFKGLVNWIAVLVMLPVSLPIRLLTAEFKPSTFFTLVCHTLSLLPGIVGVLLRRGFYYIAFDEVALDVSIGFGTCFAMRGTKIGAGTYIGPNCSIGLAVIESDVLIGSNVDLIGSPHLHSIDRTDIPIKKQGGSVEPVSIGYGSWLGNSTVILADVGCECVVGAGSVVTSACADWGIYVGNPARKIRDRRSSRSETPATAGLGEVLNHLD